MRILLCIQIVLAALLTSTVAFAQESIALRFEDLSLDNGLSQGYVGGILQDKRGLMWFVTNDGLNKYDGSTITVYRHDPDDPSSIGSNSLRCLFEDSKGRLWIGTHDNGLDYFDRETNTFYHIRHSGVASIRSNRVWAITEDKTGALWVRTTGGLERLKFLKRNDILSNQKSDYSFTKTNLLITHIDVSDSYNARRESSGPEKVFVDSKGRILVTTNENIWEVTYTAATNQYTPIKRYIFPVENRNYIAELLEDKNQHLLLNNGKITQFLTANFSSKKELATNSYYPWVVDSENRVWVWSSSRRGMASIQLNLNSGDVKHITFENPLQSNAFNTPTVYYIDHTGVLWIGTGGHGILKYDPTKEVFHHILPQQSFYQLHAISPNSFITNTFQSIKLEATKSAEITQAGYKQLLQKAVPFISTFAKDTKGDLWIGNRTYLVKFSTKDNKLKRYKIPYKNSATALYPIVTDSKDNVWMGYGSYLLKFIPTTNKFEKFRYPLESAVYQDHFLQTIYEDKGDLWLGSVEGLLKFNLKDEYFSNYYAYQENDSTSLSYNFVYSITNDAVEPTHYLWIGTNGGGLNRFDKRTSKFLRIDTKKGLPNNVVYGILPDRRGHLWLSTNKGIAEYNPATKLFRNFTAKDGLQSDEFNSLSCCKTPAGLLVFGGVNGLNYFDPDAIRPLETPKVIFTEFRLFNKLVTSKQVDSPLKKDISYTDHLTLQYSQNVLTFRFAAMDYRKIGSVKYRYRLEGFNDTWIYSGALQEATFTNLDPGNYRLVVQASFDSGLWGHQQSGLNLQIIPPWWATWWFYGLVITASLSAMYGLYRYRLAQVLQVQQLRNDIARDLHDEVGSSISSIAIYSTIVLDQLRVSPFKGESLLVKITEQATEIMGSMNDIVWSINTQNDAFEKVFIRMREQAYQLFEAKGYTLHFDLDENLHRTKLAMEKRRDFYLIYKEALNNIAKYANGKNVWIRVHNRDSMIDLLIRDDGVGFEPNAVGSQGNGLPNMSYRATALGGTLQIFSEPGKGTTLQLRF
jgi:signal transduction histidine kinase/ligand-binding sensor domain-containing protein